LHVELNNDLAIKILSKKYIITMINVHVKERLVGNWLNSSIKDVEGLYEFKFHLSLKSLNYELELKQGTSIAIIDVEDINYSLFTKEYFGSTKNVKFIGIGIKKEVTDIIELIKTNISSYVNIDSNSLELIKSIKSVENDKMYFCEQTKEHLVKKYIDEMQHKKVQLQNNEPLIAINKSEEIKSLTEKERKVSNLLAQGLSYKEIAQLLDVTTHAINQNAKSIYKKLKVRSRSELSYKIYN